jgi:hypothetical protein
MKIRVRKKEKQYAQVHRNLLFNQSISIQAKGLGAIIECYSDEFELTVKSLEKNSCLTANTLRKYLKELEIKLHLYRIQIPAKNFESVWFFDSELLDLKFVFEEIQKIKMYYKIIIVTAYQICEGGKIVYDKLNTYNNTNTSSTTFSNLDALNIMYQVNENKKKEKNKNRTYLQTPKIKNKIEIGI